MWREINRSTARLMAPTAYSLFPVRLGPRSFLLASYSRIIRHGGGLACRGRVEESGRDWASACMYLRGSAFDLPDFLLFSCSLAFLCGVGCWLMSALGRVVGLAWVGGFGDGGDGLWTRRLGWVGVEGRRGCDSCQCKLFCMIVPLICSPVKRRGASIDRAQLLAKPLVWTLNRARLRQFWALRGNGGLTNYLIASLLTYSFNRTFAVQHWVIWFLPASTTSRISGARQHIR